MSINGIDSNKSIPINNYNLKTDENKKEITSKNQNNNSLPQALEKDTFEKSTEEMNNLTYKPQVNKKLTIEEINVIKEDQENSKLNLIKKFIATTIEKQNNILGTKTTPSSLSVESSNLLTKIFGSIENAYPKIETNPKKAAEALTGDGAYSVNSVATRIMTLAKAIAGDDPDKIQKMRDAVDEGFKQAGLDFKNATNSDLPQICNDTYTEVMKRFDEWQNKELPKNTEITEV